MSVAINYIPSLGPYRLVFMMANISGTLGAFYHLIGVRASSAAAQGYELVPASVDKPLQQ